jgi:hypothetical protein
MHPAPLQRRVVSYPQSHSAITAPADGALERPRMRDGAGAPSRSNALIVGLPQPGIELVDSATARSLMGDNITLRRSSPE